MYQPEGWSAVLLSLGLLTVLATSVSLGNPVLLWGGGFLLGCAVALVVRYERHAAAN